MKLRAFGEVADVFRPKLLIAGVAIVAFGLAVLCANGSERTERVADELVAASSVLPENEGRLVIVSGTPQLADGGVIVDEEAGLQVQNAVSYSRVPLQKVYEKRSREVVVDYGEDKLSEDDDVKETEYYVVQTWIGADHKRDASIDVTAVHYENPSRVRLSAHYALGDLRVSGFSVSAGDVSRYLQTEDCWFTREELEQACGPYIAHSELALRAVSDEDGCGMLSTGDEIGDVHVLFSYETLEGAEPVTIVGRQRGDEIVLEEDDLVSEAEHIQPGVVSREEFVDAITSEDASSRKIGIGALVLGAVVILFALDLWGK